VLLVYGNGIQYFPKPGLVFFFFFLGYQAHTKTDTVNDKQPIIAISIPLGAATCLTVYLTTNRRYCPWLSLLPALVFSGKISKPKATVLSQNSMFRPVYPVPVELLLGPLYTRSQGWSSTQIKHSYCCKSWKQPQGLYTRSQGWNRKKIFSICPKLLINTELYGLVLAPRLKKRIPSNLGSQFASLVENLVFCGESII
jgi:hypothetical protein